MPAPSTSLRSYLWPHRRVMAGAVVLIAIPVALNLLLPFLVARAIDGLDAGTLTVRQLGGLAAFYMSGAGVSSVVALIMRRVPLGLAHRVEERIRSDLFAHLTRMEPAFFLGERTGDLMTRMSSDLTNLCEFLGQGLLQGTRTLLVFLLGFAVMYVISPPLTLIMVILLPMIGLIMFFMLYFVRPRYEARQEQFSELTNYTQEQFAGIRTVKGFALEPQRLARFGDINHEFIQRNLRLSRLERRIWPVLMFTFSVGTVLILVVGGRLIIEERLTLGQLVQFNQYIIYMTWPIIALGWTLNLWIRGRTSWRRIAALFERKPGIADGDRTEDAGEEVAGEIAFRGVSLDLGGRRVLDDIDLRIPEGATVGITGPTGSGKTVLVSLLTRLIEPTEGRVSIGERDVRAYPLEALRRAVGMARQESFLFSCTLAENIGFGLGDDDPAAVTWAASVAQLDREIESFPHGMATLVGERGVTLSGGQRQRTAIARAVARKPGILILDDVLSAVDTQTEARLLARLREVLRRRTALLVSHRVSTLRHADFIVVLEGGRITQLGTHEDLVNRPGYYRDLERVQRLEASLEAHE